MRNKPLDWNTLVGAVERTGNSCEAQHAIDTNAPMPLDEIGVTENDDESTVFVGTPEGEVALTETKVVYPDGVTVTFDDDTHRETVVLAVLPEHIANELCKN